MTQQYKVIHQSEIKPGKMYRTVIQDSAILIANIDGEFFAIDDQCTHEDASLYNGALKNNCVECPLHGSHFDFRTGLPQEEPATEAVKTYPVEIKNEYIYLSL